MNNYLPRTQQYISSRVPLRVLSLLIVTLLTIGFLMQSVHVPIASAQAPQDEIVGRITNGTEGGSLPENTEVLLMSIDLASNQIIEQESTKPDADGIFRFDGLLSGPGLAYRVVANAGIYTPSIDMSTVENWQNVNLTVYDETKSLEDITLSSYVMMVPTVDARSRQIGVLTVINVNNTGDRVWAPDITDPNLTGLDLLRFNLPDGFSDLSIESELPTGNILEIDTGFAMTNPIPPGEAAILMSYILPYEGDSFEFTLKLPYGADQVRMLLPDGAGEITGDGLGSLESVVVAESVFNQFQGSGYAVDDQIVAKFTGLPQPTFLQTLSEFFEGRGYMIVIIWVVGIALLGILGYALYSSRKAPSLKSADDDEMVTRTEIIAEIAELDEEYEANNIDEDEYRERRDELTSFALEFDESLGGETINDADGEPGREDEKPDDADADSGDETDDDGQSEESEK
jgi:uncharacterized membrane protein